MLKKDHKNAQAATQAGQAATELAVFGAILIFIIGTVVRSAMGSSYSQNQNFKAMRMAMLASWQGSETGQGEGASPNTSRNSASILFVEDRLSPDYNKYGDLDRNPFTAQGSGTFSYQLMYPLNQASDVLASLPIMDMYINGIHFPFTTANYVTNREISRSAFPSAPECAAMAPNSCAANQCYRNLREWAGGTGGGVVKESSFATPAEAPLVAPLITIDQACKSGNPSAANQRICQSLVNACTVFNTLANSNILTSVTGTCATMTSPGTAQGILNSAFTSIGELQESQDWNNFKNAKEPGNTYNGYVASFPGQASYNPYFDAIEAILQGGFQGGHKLFYDSAVNPGGSTVTSEFQTTAPTCKSHPCKDAELSGDVPLSDYYGNPIPDPNNNNQPMLNKDGYMQYDLLRNAYYFSNSPTPCTSSCPPPVSDPHQFPANSSANDMRQYIAWQWVATAGVIGGGDTSGGADPMIGLNPSNNEFPTWDIDGRLKDVTIYAIRQGNGGAVDVDYQDPQGGGH